MIDDAGVAVNGATVELFDRNTTTPVRASTTSNSSGFWQISHNVEGRFDVRITNGSSIRFFKYDDEAQMTTLEVANLNIRNPADTFDYSILPAAITADRILTLPLITGTDTLAVLGLAQTFTGIQTFQDDRLRIENPAASFSYTILAAAIGAARTLTLPLLTGTATIVVTPAIEDFVLPAFSVRWSSGVAVVAGEYSIQRDADGTNQLHLNVPTGATFEFSVNDVVEMNLSATNLALGTNSLTAASLLANANDSGAIGSAGTGFADLFLASGALIDFGDGNARWTHSASLLTLTIGNLSLGDNNISNVGDIALDSISADATDITILSAGGAVSIGAGAPTSSTLNIGSSGQSLLNIESTNTNGLTLTTNANAAVGDATNIVNWTHNADDDTATSRIVGRFLTVFADVTSTTLDSSMSWETMDNVNAGGVNTKATLTSAGVWTDASGRNMKTYEGDSSAVWGGRPGYVVTDLIKSLVFGRYHSSRLPEGKPIKERHISPTAEDFYDIFGVGLDPREVTIDPASGLATTNPGLAAKDIAGVALLGLQELIARVEALETI